MTIVVRYSILPSILAFLLFRRGRRVQRALCREMAAWQGETSENAQATVILFGESLGVRASRGLVKRRDVTFERERAKPGRLVATAAMWVGTPKFGGLPVPDNRVPTSRIAEFE